MIHTNKFEKSHGRGLRVDITGIVHLEWSTGLGFGPFYHCLNVFGLEDLMTKGEQFKQDMEEYTGCRVRIYILP